MIWRFRDIDREQAARLSKELNQPLKVGEFLAARRFKDAQEVKAFIKADLKGLPGPMTLTDMDKAVERLIRARQRNEMIAVCGDYDADGLTASALLTRGFRELGHQVLTRIPNRLTEGYGLKPQSVMNLAERGAKLIVTVDNGVSGHEAVEEANKLGLEVIITDHHRLPPVLPPALAVINPHRDSVWREAPPAGVGVAFLLLAAAKRHYQDQGLIEAGEGPALMEYLALVAIGTVADLVPLKGANRILVRHGLSYLASSKQPGLTALKKIARVGGEKIGPRDIGFRLAPRLNAAGRLGSAEPALELLLADGEKGAARLANRLEELNRERHQGQNRLCSEALERLEMESSPDCRTVVLAGEGWPPGLLGLAASKVAETTGKPTVLFSLGDELAVGSGRSAGNFNLYKALDEIRHLFVSFGGHSQAAGMTLRRETVYEFKKALEELAAGVADYSGEIELMVDMEVSLGDLDHLSRPLAALEPFGQEHPAPVVVIRGAKVTDVRPTDSGGEHHLKLVLGDGLDRRQVFGFNLAPRFCEISRKMDVALALDVSEFKGQINFNWRLLDFQPSDV